MGGGVLEIPPPANHQNPLGALAVRLLGQHSQGIFTRVDADGETDRPEFGHFRQGESPGVITLAWPIRGPPMLPPARIFGNRLLKPEAGSSPLRWHDIVGGMIQRLYEKEQTLV